MARAPRERRVEALVSPGGSRVTVHAGSVDRYLARGYSRPGHPEGGGRPRGNASREAWVEYAESLGVVVDPEWTRNEIRDLVEAG